MATSKQLKSGTNVKIDKEGIIRIVAVDSGVDITPIDSLTIDISLSFDAWESKTLRDMPPITRKLEVTFVDNKVTIGCNCQSHPIDWWLNSNNIRALVETHLLPTHRKSLDDLADALGSYAVLPDIDDPKFDDAVLKNVAELRKANVLLDADISAITAEIGIIIAGIAIMTGQAATVAVVSGKQAEKKPVKKAEKKPVKKAEKKK